MKIHRSRGWSLLRRAVPILALAAAGIAPAAAEQVTLTPLADNSIYSDIGSFSCGSGTNLLSGRTDKGFLRRALLVFPVDANVPAGSVITGVSLLLDVNRSRDPNDATMSLHRLNESWGEGGSDCGADPGQGAPADPAADDDATWTHRFYDLTPWGTAGGSFDPTPSASTVVGTRNVHTWTGGTLVADVQDMLDNPGSNFGWILVGNENNNKTARRFDSRESGTVSSRPQLVVDFIPPAGAEACCSVPEGFCTVTDPNNCAGTVLSGVTTCSPNLCPQPQGACCDPNSACSIAGQADCVDGGGTFQGEATTCTPDPCATGLAKFVDPLPQPPVATPVTGSPGAAATYDIAMTEFEQQLHRDLPLTTVWGYDGSYLGPTIVAGSGEPITVIWRNDIRDAGGVLRTSHYLPVDTCPHGPNYWGDSPRTVVHLHGGHTPARFDGYPEFAYPPGQSDTYVYPNLQDAATLWYHDHSLGITRLNVYMGLAGFYLLRDAQELSLNLPSGPYELGLVIQDRSFNPDGTLLYPPSLQQTFFGDTILVNGKVWPYLNVDQGKYRFRLLNGSNSRTYTLSLDNGAPFTVIGTEGGLRETPLNVSSLTIVPGERYDLVIDFAPFAPGTEIILTNSAPIEFPNPGNPTEGVIPEILKFIVQGSPGHTDPLPGFLRTVDPIPEAEAVGSRMLTLDRVPAGCGGGEWLINGLHWDDITEIPDLGTVEIWEFVNNSTIMHPMHMHLVFYQILDRIPIDPNGNPSGPPVPPEDYEIGWKDTAMAPPGTITRVIARFEDYLGKYAYHCHILEHEDHEMMRQFRVISQTCDNDGVCDPGEECFGCVDCPALDGAECGNGLCEIGNGEDCLTCPADCDGKQNGNLAGQFCCGGGGGTNPVDCSDSRCTTGGFRCRTGAVPPACCGDQMCEGAEDASTCSLDCSPNGDGDGFPDGLDCDPNDSAAGATPPEVEGVEIRDLGGGSYQVFWQTQSATAGPGTVYDVFSGTANDLRGDGGVQSGSCLAEDLGDNFLADPTATPAAGEVIYFMIRGQNGCPAGTGTFGPAPRDATHGASASPCG